MNANDETSAEAPNPYESVASRPQKSGRTIVVMKVLFLMMAFGCFLIAGFLYFFAESFETYTPYSAEKHWMIPLSNGMGMWFDAKTGMVVLISSLVAGTLLTLWPLTSIRKPRP